MRKRYVSIWFKFLKTDYYQRRQPALKETPFVLTTKQHGRILVSAVSEKAYREGVTEGMLLSDARIIVPGIQAIDDEPDLDNQLLHSLAEWCIRFTPQVSVYLPDTLILDATGCPHLWGNESNYLKEIIHRLRAFGYHIYASMSDTIGASWALSHYTGNRLIPPRQQREALYPLPVEALRIDHTIAERLNQLGLRTIAGLTAISPSALKRRFGDALLTRLQQAFGEKEEWLQYVVPLSPYIERLPCMDPIVTRTGIEIALERLLKQLCTRLQQENNGLRQCIFKAYRTDGKTLQVEIGTHRPSNNTAHLIKLFDPKLSAIEPGLGIELFVLEALLVEPLNPSTQKLWEASSIDNNRLAELVDRLSARPGAHITRYLPDEHHWPERAIKPASALDEQPLTDWQLNRHLPLCLFNTPLAIAVSAPIPDYPPMNFRLNGQLHEIIKADGPKRIEKEWWIEEGEHRDYYVVEDKNGSRYWVFRSGHYEKGNAQWFLHGEFP